MVISILIKMVTKWTWPMARGLRMVDDGLHDHNHCNGDPADDWWLVNDGWWVMDDR